MRHLSATLILLLIAAAPAAAQEQSSNPPEDWNEALEATEERLADDPDNPRLLRMKAGALFRLERYEDMQEVYEKLYDLQPEDPDIGLGYAQILLHNGDMERAMGIFDELLGRHPEDRRIYEMLSRVHGRAMNFPAVLQTLQRLRTQVPDDAELLQRVAQMQEDLERWDAARASYDTLAVLTDDPHVASRAHARILATRDSLAAAAAEYERLLADVPGDVPALEELARLRVDMEQWDAADAVLRRLLQRDSTATALVLRGRADEALDRPGEAAAAYKAATRLDLSSPLAHYRLAVLAVENGDHLLEALSAALNTLSDARREALAGPDGADRRRRLESAAAVLDDALDFVLAEREPSVAASLLGNLIGEYPNAPDLHVTLAEVYRRSGDPEAALTSLEKAAALNERVVDVQLALGDLHAEADRLRQAAQSYERALAIDPDDPRPYKGLIRTHRALGSLDALIARWQARHRTSPSPLLREHLIEALHKAGRYDEAAELTSTH